MISGLVLHLVEETVLAQAAIDQIIDHPNIELGKANGLLQPMVVESKDVKSSHHVTDWLNELPGVAHVDVTFVHLDE